MTLRSAIARITNQEDLNFLLTNRIPRRALTLFMGWFSKIEQPLVRDASIAIWKLFSDLDLSEARQQHFRSLHETKLPPAFVIDLQEREQQLNL